MKAFWISKNVAFGPIPLRSEYDEIINNFDVVISLIEKEEFRLYSYQPEYFREKGGLEVYKIYTPDYRAPKLLPSLEILQKILEYDTKGKKVYMHCVGGLGRSGALAAAYLVYKYDLKPETAIKKVRKIRPGSVQSEEQQVFVRRAYNAVFEMERDKISRLASKARENLEEETFKQVNKRTEISLDLMWGLFREESLGPITFVSSLAYSGVFTDCLRESSLNIYNIFSKRKSDGRNQKREVIKMIIELSNEVAKVIGDEIAYFKVDSHTEEGDIIAYCLSYCEDTLNAIFDKFKSSIEKGFGKSIKILVDYAW